MCDRCEQVRMALTEAGFTRAADRIQHAPDERSAAHLGEVQWVVSRRGDTVGPDLPPLTKTERDAIWKALALTERSSTDTLGCNP